MFQCHSPKSSHPLPLPQRLPSSVLDVRSFSVHFSWYYSVGSSGPVDGVGKKMANCRWFPVRFLKIEHHSSPRALITFQRWFENCPVIATCCYSVAQSCPTLCDPMDCSTPGFPVLHHLPELKFISMELVMPSNHLVLWNSSAGVSSITAWLWSYSLTC